MGGPYEIPRNYKGENKILFVFSGKSFIYTGVGGGIGILFLKLFQAIKLNIVGWILLGLFAFIGFAIGTFKIPEGSRFEISKKVGGENLDDVLKRWIKFKQKKNKIYVYKEREDAKDE